METENHGLSSKPKRYKLNARKLMSLTVLMTLLTGFMPFDQGLMAFPTSLTAQAISREQADRIFQQGVKQYQAKQLQSAIQSWQQSLTAYRTLKDRAAQATTLKNISAAYLDLADYPNAIAHLQQYLTLTRELDDRQGEQAALITLGDIYANQDSYAKAIQYYQQGLNIQNQQSQSLETGIILGQLAKAYRILGKYSAAIESNQKALQILRALKNSNLEAKVLINLGNAYQSIGDYDHAIKNYKDSLAIAQKIQDKAGEVIALGNLGTAYADQKKWDFQQNLGNVNANQKKCDSEQEKKDDEQAIAYHQQSLEISQSIGDRSGQASALINLGADYHSLGDRNQALSYYQQALEVSKAANNNKLQSEALGSLGLIYEDLQKYPQAIQYQQQSLAIVQKLGDPAAQGKALNNLGHAFFSAGKLNEAEQNLRAAVKLLDGLRLGLNDTYQVSIFDTQVSTYNLLQQILIAAKKPEASLEVSEQGRARAFAELLAKRLINDSVKTNSSVKSDAYSSSVESSPNIEKIRQIARQQNATLVEYSIVPDDDCKFRGKQRGKEQELFIWVVQPNGKVAFRRRDLKFLWQTEDKSLKNLVENSRYSIGINDRSSVEVTVVAQQKNQKEKLQILHELLISPIADLLPSDSKAHVIFIPQESLFLVPFPALKDKDGKYLIEKHTILTAPSIQVLDLTQAWKQRRNRERGENSAIKRFQSSALIVGINISKLPNIQLKPLLNAEEEANNIAQMLNTTAIVGEQATEANILKQLPKAKLVHLATHGLLEYGGQDSASSGKDLEIPGAIVLAHDTSSSVKDDGLLTADEIINLPLNAELVVLSACRTGEGRISGDGVIGLSRSLISAGTESVVVSLWSVPDQQTSELMTEFYHQLMQTDDKAQSLREAMLKLLKQDPETPRNWAAFTLIGEAE